MYNSMALMPTFLGTGILPRKVQLENWQWVGAVGNCKIEETQYYSDIMKKRLYTSTYEDLGCLYLQGAYDCDYVATWLVDGCSSSGSSRRSERLQL